MPTYEPSFTTWADGLMTRDDSVKVTDLIGLWVKGGAREKESISVQQHYTIEGERYQT